MKKSFKIVTKDKEILEECNQYIFDIIDSRGLFSPKNFSSEIKRIGEVHYKVLEKITHQISPVIMREIYEKKDKKVIKSGRICFCSDYAYIKNDSLYMILTLLIGKRHCINCSFWIKTNLQNGSFDFSSPTECDFELCNEQEHKMCYILMTGMPQRLSYWLDELYSHEQIIDQTLSQKKGKEEKEVSYPDIVLDIHLKKKDEDIENALYSHIVNFVNDWNRINDEKIHECVLEENLSDKVVSVYIDFASCPPIALQRLIEDLEKTNFHIKKIKTH